MKLSELDLTEESESSDNEVAESDDAPLEAIADDSVWFGYNIKGLQPQTKYEIRVQTQNEAGWSPESEQLVFSTSHIGKYEMVCDALSVMEYTEIN